MPVRPAASHPNGLGPLGGVGPMPVHPGRTCGIWRARVLATTAAGRDLRMWRPVGAPPLSARGGAPALLGWAGALYVIRGRRRGAADRRRDAVHEDVEL